MTPVTVKSKKNGNTYYPHATLGANKQTVMYYFAKEINPERAVTVMPEDREVSESPTTGLPVLKKKTASAA